MNPLSQEQEILRPSLIPSLVRCVAGNLNQQQGQVNIFEIAKAFSGNQPKEELVLGIALSGARSLLLEQGLIKDCLGMLHLKGILEALFERLCIKKYDFSAKDNPDVIDVYANNERIGAITKIQKNILDKLDIKNKDVFALELSLDKLFSYAWLKKGFVSLPKYPGITRDISFILKEDIAVKDLLIAIEEKGRPMLSSVKVVDYYKGKQIPAGFRGLTVSCCYRSGERTLTEAEINPVHTLICDLLQQRFGAKIR
jgi:phenylalanyl-tRNA synthetase beta chain